MAKVLHRVYVQLLMIASYVSAHGTFHTQNVPLTHVRRLFMSSLTTHHVL